MKAVYIHKIITKLNINGEWKNVDDKFIGGRYIYKYGEIPKNYTEKLFFVINQYKLVAKISEFLYNFIIIERGGIIVWIKRLRNALK